MKTTTSIDGVSVPVHVANTVIVGAGAAGMNAAVHLVEFWREKGIRDPARRVLVVTRGLGLGASRMSGSDKQTYYKMGTSPRVPDTALDFAGALTAGGCCHGDTALAEGLGSLREFYHLVQAGVPFPHDPWGAFVGYKTDHDPGERATSAGPKTSRFMSECLQRQAEGYGVPILEGFEPLKFVTDRDRILGMICLERSRLKQRLNGLTLFVAENWILAAGGPGGIYADTVYPPGQIGLHAPALEAGLEAVNLTESQYGLASTKFRWNVSGTYMQAVPRVFSTAPDGEDPRDFLTEYFDDMPSLASAIFLKGYQWPFDAGRIAKGQSSLIDLAVHQERAWRGRRVWLDFRRNPLGRSGWEDFRLDALAPEARAYLDKAGATQATPLERLLHMNRPAVAVYAEHGIDLAAEPLEIALCAQHHNGGFAVNAWWESNLPHTFVIGEMAGTHGCRRPGGSALNAGQVGGLRAAEFIANAYSADRPDFQGQKALLREALKQVRTEMERLKGSRSRTSPRQTCAEIAARMSGCAAHIRSRQLARRGLQEAREQHRRLQEQGLKVRTPGDLVAAFQARQQCLTHLAMLYAVDQMLARGAGSRGSHCVLDAGGEQAHPKVIDPATGLALRIQPENPSLREHLLVVRYDPEAENLFQCRDEKPRPVPRRDIAFETAWREFREGGIYRAGDQPAARRKQL